jgi:hypothetical protein
LLTFSCAEIIRHWIVVSSSYHSLLRDNKLFTAVV